jgi:hypothetical protein
LRFQFETSNFIADYSFARSKLRELQTVAANVEAMLGVKLSPEHAPANRIK